MTPTVEVLCSARGTHIWQALERWCEKGAHTLVSSKGALQGGDLLLLVSCYEIVEPEIRAKYRKCALIHESALPHGRGWSPFAWQILDGRNEITISLLEVADPVDSGAIWKQKTVKFDGTELSSDLNAVRDAARISLCQWAVENFETVAPVPQAGEPTFYRRRVPRDSKIDVKRPLAEQFDLLRIVEPRFPAYFEMRGAFYEMTVRKIA